MSSIKSKEKVEHFVKGSSIESINIDNGSIDLSIGDQNKDKLRLFIAVKKLSVDLSQISVTKNTRKKDYKEAIANALKNYDLLTKKNEKAIKFELNSNIKFKGTQESESVYIGRFTFPDKTLFYGLFKKRGSFPFEGVLVDSSHYRIGRFEWDEKFEPDTINLNSWQGLEFFTN